MPGIGLVIMIDIHTHILPQLDDGPQTMEEAVRMCRMARQDGITVLTATPHMFCDAGNPEISTVSASCDKLKKQLKKEDIDIQIRSAGEIRINENVIQLAEQKRLPFFDSAGRYILLEPPFTGCYDDLFSRTVFELRLRGIIPVVAHPERCEMFKRNDGLAEKIFTQGALLQINASSVLKMQNETDDYFVRNLFLKDLVHACASDAHDSSSRPPCLSGAYRICANEFGEDTAYRVFCDNPGRILSGEDVDTSRPAEYTDRPHETGNRLQKLFRRFYERLATP